MKLFSKVAVLAAALMVVSVFAGCKNAEDEGDGVVAVYKGYPSKTKIKDAVLSSVDAREADIPTDKPYANLTFYDDDTFNVTLLVAEEEPEIAVGTYSGDPSKDGKIKIEVEKMANLSEKNSSYTLIPLPEEEKEYINGEYKISDGELFFPPFIFIREE